MKQCFTPQRFLTFPYLSTVMYGDGALKLLHLPVILAPRIKAPRADIASPGFRGAFPFREVSTNGLESAPHTNAVNVSALDLNGDRKADYAVYRLNSNTPQYRFGGNGDHPIANCDTH